MPTRDEMLVELGEELWRVQRAGSVVPIGITPSLSRPINQSAWRTLAISILSVSRSLSAFLEETACSLRRMPSIGSTKYSETDGYVRGEVDWLRTHQERVQRSHATLFVEAEILRSYDYLRARAIRYTLRRVHELLSERIETGDDLNHIATEHLSTVRRLLTHPKLRKVRQVSMLHESQLNALSSRGDCRDLVRMVRCIKQLFDERSPEALSELCREEYFAPADSDLLFEFVVGFRMVDFFELAGYVVHDLHLVPHLRQPFCLMKKDDEVLRIWYQRSLIQVLPDVVESRYAEVRAHNGLSRSALRPDFLLDFGGDRRCLVEVKYSSVDSDSHVRNGLIDMFAYISDTPDAFGSGESLWGIVVASDIVARPSPHHGIAVSSQDTLHDVLQNLVSAGSEVAV